MTFTDAIQNGFRKGLTFSGRSSRREFWYFMLFVVIGQLLLIGLNGMMFGPNIEEGMQTSVALNGTQSTSEYTRIVYTGGWLGTLFILGIFLPLLSLTLRRLHDRSRPGWLCLVPSVLLVAAWGLLLLTGERTVFVDPASGQAMSSIMPQSAAFVPLSALAILGSALAVFVILCRASVPGANRYGPNPNEVPS